MSWPLTGYGASLRWRKGPWQACRQIYQDAMTYLPDDILCKVDCTAMGCGLEIFKPPSRS